MPPLRYKHIKLNGKLKGRYQAMSALRARVQNPKTGRWMLQQQTPESSTSSSRLEDTLCQTMTDEALGSTPEDKLFSFASIALNGSASYCGVRTHKKKRRADRGRTGTGSGSGSSRTDCTSLQDGTGDGSVLTLTSSMSEAFASVADMCLDQVSGSGAGTLYTKRKQKRLLQWCDIHQKLQEVHTELSAPSGAGVQCSECQSDRDEMLILRCQDCGSAAYFCLSHYMQHHRHAPLHSPDVWNDNVCMSKGKVFVPFHPERPTLTRQDHAQSQCFRRTKTVAVVGLKGRRQMVKVEFCTCEAEPVTLLRHGLWAASPDNPSTAFHLDLMEWLRVLAQECQVSVKGFVHALTLRMDKLDQMEVSEVNGLYQALVTDSFSQYMHHHYQCWHPQQAHGAPDHTDHCPACQKCRDLGISKGKAKRGPRGGQKKEKAAIEAKTSSDKQTLEVEATSVQKEGDGGGGGGPHTHEWRQQLQVLSTDHLEVMAHSLHVPVTDLHRSTCRPGTAADQAYREQVITRCIVEGSSRLIPAFAAFISQLSPSTQRADDVNPLHGHQHQTPTPTQQLPDHTGHADHPSSYIPQPQFHRSRFSGPQFGAAQNSWPHFSGPQYNMGQFSTPLNAGAGHVAETNAHSAIQNMERSVSLSTSLFHLPTLTNQQAVTFGKRGLSGANPETE